MTNAELLQAIESLRNTMVSVATGGSRIQDVENNFQSTIAIVAAELRRRNIENPIPFRSLWDWHGRWSSGDLPSYRSRRSFLADMFNPLLNKINLGYEDLPPPTGWERVDRAVGEFRERLALGTAEEHFQAVGLLCREALISLAQAIFDPSKHPILDGVLTSKTDAKRMLEAYIAAEFGGSSKEARAHARSALALALNLQHKRTATFRDAALCVEATASVINIIAIVAGKRDP